MPEVTGAPRALSELRATLDRMWLDLPREAATVPMVTAEVFLQTPDGPVRLGVDTGGARHLLVPVSSSTRAKEDSRSAGVSVRTNDLLVEGRPIRFLDLQCRRPDLHGVFTGLCADVCELVAESAVDLPRRVGAKLTEWRRLLGPSQAAWTQLRIAGLHGELLVLEHLLTLDAGCADFWTGPFGAAHDFHNGSDAVEVKSTISASGRLVHIHGTDQLESPAGGLLTLAWIRLVDSKAGQTTNELLDRCRSLAADPGVLVRALDELRLPDPAEPLMCRLRLEAREQRWYGVGESFPRITPSLMLDSVVPAGVGQVEYLVDLDVVPDWADQGDVVLTGLVGRP